MQVTLDERRRYERRQLMLADRGPWLTPVLPGLSSFLGWCVVVLCLSWGPYVLTSVYQGTLLHGIGALETPWYLMLSGLLFVTLLYGVCGAFRAAIRVCPACYEEVAGGAHRCHCGFDDGGLR